MWKKLILKFLTQWGPLASGWISHASHFKWPKFISIPLPTNTHLPAHTALAAVWMLLCKASLVLISAASSALPYGIGGPSGSPGHTMEKSAAVHWTLTMAQDNKQLSSWKVPETEFARFLKRAVVTSWQATFPWRVLCSWEAAIAVFQRLSYNWTMYEDV